MKKYFVLAFVIFSVVSKAFAADDSDLRAALIDSENIDEVIVIDEYHTHVFPKLIGVGVHSGEPTVELSSEIVSLCSTSLEVDSVATDPISKETKQDWIPYDGKSYIFHRYRIDPISGNGKAFYKVRCNGEFSIESSYIYDANKVARGLVRSFIVTHNKPQKYAFKSRKLASNDIAMKPDGDFTLSKMNVGGFFKSIVGMETSNDGATLFQYATALCHNNNGAIRFVIQKYYPGIKNKYPEMVESTAAETLDYSLHATASMPRLIIYACDGAKKFVIRSEDNFRKNYFANNRGLEGVQYKGSKP